MEAIEKLLNSMAKLLTKSISKSVSRERGLGLIKETMRKGFVI